MSRLPEQAAAADSGHVLTGSPVDDCSPINLTRAMEVGRRLLNRPERRVQQGLTALLEVRAHPSGAQALEEGGSGVRQELDSGGVGERGGGKRDNCCL